MMRRLVAAILIAFTVSCASVPLKQKAVTTHQAMHLALVEVDDLERDLCAPEPTRTNHCTAASATLIGLTDAKHQRISNQIAAAYKVDIDLSTALITWRSGEPAPKEIDQMLMAAQETLTAIEPLTGKGAGLVDKARSWINKIGDFAALFQKK